MHNLPPATGYHVSLKVLATRVERVWGAPGGKQSTARGQRSFRLPPSHSVGEARQRIAPHPTSRSIQEFWFCTILGRLPGLFSSLRSRSPGPRHRPNFTNCFCLLFWFWFLNSLTLEPRLALNFQSF